MASLNKVRAAHDTLGALLVALAPDGAALARNPGGHTAPKAREAGVLVPYFALVDDRDPSVLAALLGGGNPTYDLSVTPTVT
ncbi:MAG TPA: hypothetical protein VEA79_07575, partial [Phenylobacterium sp.]|nr:hypothetical protein [Phenylobacterium sp.]